MITGSCARRIGQSSMCLIKSSTDLAWMPRACARTGSTSKFLRALRQLANITWNALSRWKQHLPFSVTFNLLDFQLEFGNIRQLMSCFPSEPLLNLYYLNWKSKLRQRQVETKIQFLMVQLAPTVTNLDDLTGLNQISHLSQLRRRGISIWM